MARKSQAVVELLEDDIEQGQALLASTKWPRSTPNTTTRSALWLHNWAINYRPIARTQT